MFEQQKQKSLSELLTLLSVAFSRYARVAFYPAVALSTLLLLLSLTLPSYFESEALIFVQPQRISSKVVDTPKRDEMLERMQALVQQILSRSRLRSIIEQHKLYPEYQGVKGKERALKKFQKNIEIQPIQSPTGKQLLNTFQLTFSYRSAQTVFDVTRALSNLFIEESQIDRQVEVQGTKEFLDSQILQVKRKLEETEKKVTKFVSENFGKLPEYLKPTLARLQNSQAQLATNSQLISTNIARRAQLEEQLKSANEIGSAVVGDASLGSGDPYESLAQLESALVILKSKYSDKHPDVIRTEKRIQALKKRLDSKASSTNEDGSRSRASTLAVRKINALIKEIDFRNKLLEEENQQLKEAVKKLESDLSEMPIKEQELIKIKRNYENIQANYQRLLAAREEAQIQSSLVRTQKGAQFKIVDPAELPALPAGPPRIIIASIAIVLGLLIQFGLPLFLFFLNGAYKFASEMEEDIGIPVLAVVPPMITPETQRYYSGMHSSSLFASAAALIVGILVIIFAV